MQPEPRTREYFNKEICSFREMMGLKKYWESDGHELLPIDRAFKGLTHVYLTSVATNPHDSSTPEDLDAIQFAYEALFAEFTRRHELMASLKLRELLGAA